MTSMENSRRTSGTCAGGWLMSATFGALLLLCSGAAEAQQQQQIVSGEPDQPPYLLVAGQTAIYKMYTNGTEPQILITENSIKAVAYHYRLDYIFWINDVYRTIKRAHLNGSNIIEIAVGNIQDPVDLVVDWIRDKLYWSDSARKTIEELDIITLERRTVIQLHASSNPLGLAIYPLQDQSLLYWTDNIEQNLQRVLTSGHSHAVIHSHLPCTWPVTVNYRQKMLYWSNNCAYTIESLLMNGSSHDVVVQSNAELVQFNQGLSEFDNVLYWTSANKVYMKSGSNVTPIYTGSSSQRFNDITVVHPRMQPTFEEFQKLTSSGDVYGPCLCQNGGTCVLPGVCICPQPWEGVTCEEESSVTLPTSTVVPPVTSSNTPPSPNINPTTTTSVSLTPSIPDPVTSTTEGLTADVDVPVVSSTDVRLEESAVRVVATQGGVIAPSSSAHGAVISTTDNVSPSRAHVERVIATTAAPVKASNKPDKYNNNNAYTETLTPPQPTQSVVASSAILQTPLPTQNIDSMVYPPTINGINEAEKESNSMVYIIPVSVIAGFILLSIGVFLVAMIYLHCRTQRRGSYSFASPAILEIAAEISSNTLKRGQVTRKSFRQVGYTPDVPSTMAILSPTTTHSPSNSAISGSESFEWNTQNDNN